MKHVFTATTVSIQPDPLLIAFGNVAADQTVRQALLLSRDDELDPIEAFRLELNEQGNACSGRDLERLELGKDRLRIFLRPAARLRGGAYDGVGTERISEIDVRFAVEPARRLILDEALRGATDGSVPLTFRR